MVRRTKEDAAATRAAVLDAALQVFSRKGYAATRLEEVATEAGVTRGAVYWHFAGKAELYGALMQERMGRLVALHEEALGPAGRRAPMAAIERLLVRSIDYLQEDPEFRAVMELNWFKTELTPELAAGFEHKIAGVRRLVDALAELLRAAIAAGEAAPDLDPRAAAVATASFAQGLMAMALMDGELLGSRAATRRVIQTFLRALRS